MLKLVLLVTFFVLSLFSITYITIDSRHGDSIEGYESSEHEFPFITEPLGKEEYLCTGICYCGDDSTNERRLSTSIVQKGVTRLVFAISAVLAYTSSRKFFEDDCRSRFSSTECLQESVKSQVENCDKVMNSVSQQDVSGRDSSGRDRVFELKPIGIVRSIWKDPNRRPKLDEHQKVTGGATIEIYDDFLDGIEDLEGFSHIYVFFVFDRVEKTELKVHPFRDKKRKIRGVYSTRAPVRPNRMGMSLVKIIRIEGNLIHIDGIDALDGTPVIDLKPYLGNRLSREEEKDVTTGWFSWDKVPDRKIPGRGLPTKS